MSLVVGEIHDGRISLVADTKVTYAGDDRSTRHVFENAFPKLLILRDDLCVGLAGNDPEGVAESLLAVRSEPLEQVLVIAEALVHASFVVASLGPAPRLLQVDQGSTQDRTEIGRAWVGDVNRPGSHVCSLGWFLMPHRAETGEGSRRLRTRPG